MHGLRSQIGLTSRGCYVLGSVVVDRLPCLQGGMKGSQGHEMWESISHSLAQRNH